METYQLNTLVDEIHEEVCTKDVGLFEFNELHSEETEKKIVRAVLIAVLNHIGLGEGDAATPNS